MYKKIFWFFLIFCFLSIISVGVITYKMHQYSLQHPSKDMDYLIVLGAKVNGKTPSLSLQYRIETAASYLKENPNTIAILSGGQGPHEDITEAEAMYQTLTSMGIAKERLIQEDQSTSTKENILFSKKLLSVNMKKGIVVTNDFHVYRAVKVARKNNLDVEGLAAKTPKDKQIQSNIREYFAIMKYFLMRDI